MAFALFPLRTNAQLTEGGIPAGFSMRTGVTAHTMPAFNVDSMLNEDAVNEQYKDRPYRFGYNHMVNFGLNNSGTWTTLANGDRVWQLAIKSVGAYTLNFGFSHFYLPEGAKLFFYTADRKQVIGAVTSKQNTRDHFFGTDLLYSDEAVVEYYEPAAVVGQGSLILFRVTHGYKDLASHMKSFGQAGNCINNVNCPQYSAYSDQKRSVVCVVENGNEACSGALINNTSNDGTPYILTANHCGVADGTWVFRFNWEAPGCTNPTSSPSTTQSISGGTPVAQDAVSDFNLILMSSTPPANYNVFYAGWNHGRTPATSVTCIHHPSGDIKKCSQASNAVYSSTYSGEVVWAIGTWTDGVTEPGSSGSPLFDQNKRIVGQLFGGPSSCNASGSNLTDNYGQFCISWDSINSSSSRLKDWLDPGNTGALTNDGYDPNLILVNLDAGVSITSPAGSLCPGSTIAPVVVLRNGGRTRLTSATINYYTDANTPATYNWTGVLDSLQTTNITLPAITAASGTHTFNVSVSNPNNGTDLNPADDNAQSTFVVLTSFSLPFTENFEAGTIPPANWSITTPSSGYTWDNGNVGAYGASTNSGMVDNFSPFFDNTGDHADLLSPMVDFSTAISPAYVAFDVAYAQYNANHSDSLVVMVSTDCGNSWSTIYAKGGSGLATAANTTNAFVPTSSQWRRDSVNINNLVGQSAVKFDFIVVSDWGNITYVDNINIHAAHLATDLKEVAGFTATAYPNPFTDNITLSLQLDEAKAINAALYSIDGKLVKQVYNDNMDAGQHNIEVATNNLSNGLYILKVNNQFMKVEKAK